MSRHLPGHTRLFVALGLGALIAGLLSQIVDPVLALLAGISTMSGSFVVVSLVSQWGLDAGRT